VPLTIWGPSIPYLYSLPPLDPHNEKILGREFERKKLTNHANTILHLVTCITGELSANASGAG
jgi:hypothetical protein